MSEYIVKNKDSLKPGMVDVPVEIDNLTDEQYKYIHGYEEGT